MYFSHWFNNLDLEFQTLCLFHKFIEKYLYISEYGRLHDIKNDIVSRLKSDKKPCKYFYKLYLENIKESPVRSQNKWTDQELGVQIDDWGYI